MRRQAWSAAVLTGLCLVTVGCGSSSAPSTETAPPSVDLGQPAADAPAGDETPVLPIPDDLTPTESTPTEAPIKPIPDDEPAAPKAE